jgi:opacity protein-like surface antigen
MAKEFMRLKIKPLLNHPLTFFFIIACFLYPYSNVFAQGKTDTINADYYRYIIGLDIGISATTTLGNTTSFPLGYSTFNYSANNTIDDPLRFGAVLRRSFQLSPHHALQLGMSYHYTTNMDVDGSLQQGISPPFYPFTYHYSIDSSQVLAEAKLLQQWRDVFYPYLIGGIGAGFNRAKNYSTSIPDYLTFTPYYVDKSTTSFSYTVGLGIDFLKFQSLSLGLGYRFSDLGRAELGNGSIRNRQIAGQLKQSHLYLNTALLEVNYFF